MMSNIITMLKQIKENYKNENKAKKKEYKKRAKALRSEYKSESLTRRDSYRRRREEYCIANGIPLPTNPPKRSVLEEIGNSVTHGVGSVFAVVAIILMLSSYKTGAELAGAIVYSIGLFVMFTISCIYHALPYGSTVKRIFRRFDYSSIYLLIGATFAPILLAFIGGTLGYVFFGIQWTIITVGITVIAVFGPTRFRKFHIPMYLLLGWSGLILMPKMLAVPPFFWLIVGGGAVYSLGVIPFAIKAKVSHFIWHFFVLAGAVVQWIGIYLYIFLA